MKEGFTACCLYKTVLLIVDFAICDRQAFGNEALGLSRRYIGELNFPMTPGFTTQNCFLTQQTERKKKKYVFHRTTEGKGERHHLLLKTTHPQPIIFSVWICPDTVDSFCGKGCLLLSSAEGLLAERPRPSRVSASPGSDGRETQGPIRS